MNQFFALTVPPSVAVPLAETAVRWQSLLPPDLSVRWEDPQNYHITLNFLGDLARSVQPRLIKAARPVAEKTAPFRIHITSCGVFPDTRNPSALWVSMGEKRNTAALSKQMDSALCEHGFVFPKHSYKPHLTLGRCGWRQMLDALPPVRTNLPVNIELMVDGFALLETLPIDARRNGRNSRYNIVHTFPFGGQDARGAQGD